MQKAFRIILFFVSISVLASPTLHAQNAYLYTQIGTERGLSDNRIRFLLQLADGRMAVFTEGSLNLYDGSSFKYIHLDRKDIYPLSGYTRFLMAYEDGSYIWFKTGGWLALVDVRQGRCISDIQAVFRTMGIRDTVVDFVMDDARNYWMRTASNRLYLKRNGEKKASVFLQDIQGTGTLEDELFNVTSVDHHVFLLYRFGQLACYDMKTRRMEYRVNTLSAKQQIYKSVLNTISSDKYVFQVRNDPGGLGLVTAFDIKSHKVITLLETDTWLNVPSLDKEGNLWVGAREGIWVINKNLETKRLITDFRMARGFDVKNEITCQFHDSQGGLWLGSFNRGLFYYHQDQFKFKRKGKDLFEQQKEDFEVTGFCDTRDGKILVGTSRGLFTCDTDFSQLKRVSGLPRETNCTSIMNGSDGRIWISTMSNGLYYLGKEGLKNIPLPYTSIYKMVEIQHGTFLLATNNGLKKLEKDGSMTELSIGELGHPSVTQLIPFNDHTVLGRAESGLFLFDHQRRKLVPFPDYVSHKDIHMYNCLLRDSRNLIWIGTSDGLVVWNPVRKTVQRLFVEDGMANNTVKGLIEDRSGRIWISTSEGVSCLTVERKDQRLDFSFANYNRYEGVLPEEFTSNAVYLTWDGYLLLGGVNGFNTLFLEKPLARFAQMPVPLFSNLLLFGESVVVGREYDKRVLLSQSITYTDRVIFDHDQNFVSIEFSALNYVNPTQTYFKYRLIGVDDGWCEISRITGRGLATYTDLSPGEYVFEVKSANSSKVWSNNVARIVLEVRPPIWGTTLAYILYFLTALAMAIISHHYYRRKVHETNVRKNDEKLNKMKFVFFTNISHEFRTPLTLIITPLESMLKEVKGSLLEPRLQAIYRHARDLQSLVNQLLDFRKLEIHGERLYLTFGDMVTFIKQFEELFARLAHEKTISFVIDSTLKQCMIFYDRDKVYRIVNNLLSNAFKFTPSGGAIQVMIRDSEQSDCIEISVSDSGRGIPYADQELIFNRFYQIDGTESGSGIGLHLAKEYAELHMGSIRVSSEPGKGATFTLTLPKTLSPSKVEEVPGDVGIVPESTVKPDKRFALLVVEDNDELRRYIVRELSAYYDIMEAVDGSTGFDLAQHRQPDLIVCDVMMPGMNGIELCKHIKTTLETSHIPVVLLTALASDESKLEGYQAGADEYISKPFNLDILLVRIARLIENQQQRHEVFTRKIEVNPKEITFTSLDEQFIEKALNSIEQNMDNPDYSVHQFSLEMGMDRTGLYKKLLAIVGVSPSDFIRSIRMKRAAQLLLDGHASISEVAERVGYQTAGSFSKKFKEAFGTSPSQYMHAAEEKGSTVKPQDLP